MHYYKCTVITSKSYNFHTVKQHVDSFLGNTVMPVLQLYAQLYVSKHSP